MKDEEKTAEYLPVAKVVAIVAADMDKAGESFKKCVSPEVYFLRFRHHLTRAGLLPGDVEVAVAEARKRLVPHV